jgi:predicted nucleic acid-binding Zn ribbon protein
MVDLEVVDKWFEVGYQLGNVIHFGLFDRRVLLSWEQLADRIYLMTGKNLTLEDLTSLQDRGWIPILSNPNDPENGIGIPMYADSQIQLLWELERHGYSPSELQSIAKWEEEAIDSFLAVDDLVYLDDDLELMINHMKCRILQADLCSMRRGIGDSPGEPVSIPRERYERKLRMYEQFQRIGIPGDYQYDVAKAAFRVRAIHEAIRVEISDMERAQIRAGYSPFVVCTSTWRSSDRKLLFDARGIHWEPTIKTAVAHTEEDVPTIRIPGFLLHGDQVVPTKTLTPRNYEQLWKEHHLDQYLLAWATVQGEKRCLNCLSTLPDSSDLRRRYCSDRCRNALKQKRYREKNPDAAFEANRKYYTSLDD